MELVGKQILVVGLGKSGLAVAAFLRSQQARVFVTDSKPIAQIAVLEDRLMEIGVTYVSESYAVQPGIDLLVLSPGVPLDSPLVEHARRLGIAITGELEVAAPFLQGRKIGITGSNGKTTSTALTYHILQSCGVPSLVGGNIGVPPSAMIEQSKSAAWLALELSSFQLETIKTFRADIAVCLNVTPDHLDRHKTMKAYAEAKRHLFETQTADDVAILSATDSWTVEFANASNARKCWFTSDPKGLTNGEGFWLESSSIMSSFGPLMPISEVPLPGLHNLENVMAASAACYFAGLKLDAIADGVRTFQGVPHRLEFVRDVNGVRYYNDSKATNVDATMKALQSFPAGIWVILGGKDKDSDYSVLAPLLRERALGAFLIGSAAEKIAGQLAGAVPLFPARVMEEAVRRAYQHAHAGETVLLAPACASFDQFDNYEHRGQVFKTLVAQLPEGVKS